MRTIAYARVSTDDQNLDLQRLALTAAGYELIFEDDGVSAVADRRPGFEAALAALRPGDTFLVWKNDRAFRRLKDAFLAMERFQSIGVTYHSLTEFIDTSTPIGRAMFYILNVFSELERELIGERTKAGLEATRRNGTVLGRRPKLSDVEVEWARGKLQRECGVTAKAVAAQLHVSPRTLSRALALRTP